MVTDDGGHTWNTPIEEANYIQEFLLEENGIAYIAGGGYGNDHYRKSDYGQTSDTIINTPVNKFIFSDDNIVYAHSLKGILSNYDFILGVSEDYGVSRTFVDLPFTNTDITFVDSQHGFATDKINVWNTTTGGEEWVKIDNLTNIQKNFL